MNKLRLTIPVIFMSLISTLTYAQEWQLVWQDEFTTTISSDWVYDLGDAEGWWNEELQYYKKENATVENGKLVITAKKEAAGNSKYTSARMKTYGKKSWKYGKIEASIAMPMAKGLWPAFWMMGNNSEQSSGEWPRCGEFDIMEHINTESTIYGAMHWQNASETHQEMGGQKNISNPAAYHTYAIEWTTDSVKWLVDNLVYYKTSIKASHQSEFHQNFYILLNLAVGGEWPGSTIDETKLPAKMYVEYVRVYQKAATTPTAPEESDKTVSAYPNPATSNVTVQIGNGWKGGKITLSNNAGRQISTAVIKSTEHTFDLSGLPVGQYIITLTSGTSKVSHSVYKK